MSAPTTIALDPDRAPDTLLQFSPAALGVMVLGAAALYALVAALRWPMVHDATLLNYIGWSIANGGVPYASLFDMNLPGTYVFHTLLALLPGSWDARTSIAHVALVSLCATFVGIVARRSSNRPLVGVLAAAICVLFCIRLGPAQAIQRDLLLSVPTLLALLVISAVEVPGHRRALLAGLLFGMASSVKPQALIFPACYAAAFILHHGVARSTWLRLASSTFAIGIGVALVWLPLLAWLSWSGGLSEFTGTILPLNASVYVRINQAVITGSSAGVLHSFIAPELLQLTTDRFLRACAVAAVLYDVLFDRRSLPRLTADLALLGAIAMYFLQLKGWPYHLYPSLVLLGIPISRILLDGTTGTASGKEARARFVLQIVVWGALLSVTAAAIRTASSDLPEPVKLQRVEQVVRGLSPRLRADDRVQIFDTAEGGAAALLQLRLPLPTTMLYDFPLFLPELGPEFATDTVLRLRTRFLAELERARPAYLVVFADGWPRGGFERLTWVPELASWIEADYCPVEERDDYRILARRERGECSPERQERS